MLNKFKNWLGIEGLKVELLIPEETTIQSGFVDGRLIFTSKQSQTVHHITIQIFERYTRGRGKDQKVDEFEIGTITYEEAIQIRSFEETFLDFALPFQLEYSNIDDFESKNLITKGLAKAAKAIHQVKSEYRVVATAIVKGTALNPFDEKWITIK